MGLQKHEKDAIDRAIEVAAISGVSARRGEARNTKHPTNVVFEYGGTRIVMSIPSSPRVRDNTVRLAGQIAGKICRNLISGTSQPPFYRL